MITLMAHSKRATPDWAEVCRQLRSALQDALDVMDSALYSGEDPATAVDSVVSDLQPVIKQLSVDLGGE